MKKPTNREVVCWKALG